MSLSTVQTPTKRFRADFLETQFLVLVVYTGEEGWPHTGLPKIPRLSFTFRLSLEHLLAQGLPFKTGSTFPFDESFFRERSSSPLTSQLGGGVGKIDSSRRTSIKRFR